MARGMKWRAEDSVVRDGVLLYRLETDDDGRRYMHEGAFNRVPIEPNSFYPGEATVQLAYDEAQQLINELWRIGMRPKDGSASLAHVDAMQAHLQDMRKLVFDKHDVEVLRSREKSG